MPVRVRSLASRCLPHGPLDLVRQVLLFAAAYFLYRLTRGLVSHPEAAAAAFANARSLIDIERALNVFIEPSVQGLVAGQQWLLDVSSWLYINAQTSVTVAALAWLYVCRNESFYFVRNMFLVAFAIALAGYMLFPTAPPRFMPEYGFFDAVADFTGVPHDSVAVDALFNPYAAVPSMHVGFALMIALPLARLVRHRAVRAFWLFYPVLVCFVIVATANHFIADAVLGAATAGLGALAAWGMAQTRPGAWSLGTRATAEAAAA
jgi:hypothetical protein